MPNSIPVQEEECEWFLTWGHQLSKHCFSCLFTASALTSMYCMDYPVGKLHELHSINLQVSLNICWLLWVHIVSLASLCNPFCQQHHRHIYQLVTERHSIIQ
jgi:hypothetical protein